MEIYGCKESKSERDKAKELMGVLKREREWVESLSASQKGKPKK